MVSTRPLKVFCGIWHQDFCCRSLRICVQHIPQMFDQTEIWEIQRPCLHFQLFYISQTTPGSIILLKEASGLNNNITMNKCTWIETMFSTTECQRNIHMYVRTWSFPAIITKKKVKFCLLVTATTVPNYRLIKRYKENSQNSQNINYSINPPVMARFCTDLPC